MSGRRIWLAPVLAIGVDKMPNLGGWEWVIILVIVLLIFGVGRIGRLGEELGKGVSAFRQGIREETEEESVEDEVKKEVDQ
jgi:sec-independent protein translocase protein TatA